MEAARIRNETNFTLNLNEATGELEPELPKKLF